MVDFRLMLLQVGKRIVGFGLLYLGFNLLVFRLYVLDLIFLIHSIQSARAPLVQE